MLLWSVIPVTEYTYKILMKKITFISFFLLFFLPLQGEAGNIKMASIPDVNLNPSLQSVLRQKDSLLTNQKKEDTGQEVQISTNGYVLDNGNIIVDSLSEPKCIFYGNYNEGSGDIFQYIDIDTLVLNCQ